MDHVYLHQCIKQVFREALPGFIALRGIIAGDHIYQIKLRDYKNILASEAVCIVHVISLVITHPPLVTVGSVQILITAEICGIRAPP